MKTILNYQLLNKLLSEGNSYKEIVQKTGYNSNSVYGYFYKKFGSLKYFTYLYNMENLDKITQTLGGYPAMSNAEFLKRSALIRRLPELFEQIKNIK